MLKRRADAPPVRAVGASVPLTFKLTWPFMAMVLLQVLLAGGSIHVMSAVRAFVAGESQWSKGQKDAIHRLDIFAATGDAVQFERFTAAIAAPLGDQIARNALDLAQPDLPAARRGCLQGGNHAEDIDRLIWLYRHFRSFPLMREPVRHWQVGDGYMNQLQALSSEIAGRRAAGPVDAATVRKWREQIQVIDAGVSPVASAFSAALGESSRGIVAILLGLNLAVAALLIGLAVRHTRRLLAQGRLFEIALGAEKERAQTTLAAIGDGVITTDAEGRVAYLNAAAELLLGRSAAHALGQPLATLLAFEAEAGRPDEAPLVQRILAGEPLLRDEHTRRLVRPDETIVPVKLVGSALHQGGQGNGAGGAVLVLHDVTREQHYVEQLSWQASHDALTGLANRREFERRLEGLLASPRTVEREGALLYVDLDQFKIINDTCGHQAGDEMLRAVCRMLQQGLRDGDTLARLGGDEFGILLPNCPGAPALRIAEQLRQTAQELRVAWGDRMLGVGLSIGLVHLTPALQTLEEVLRMADMACYRAKERGRNRVHVYQADDAAAAGTVGDMDWMQRLRSALAHHRFILYAQDIAPLGKTGDPADQGHHVEVLLRLRDEAGELVSPGLFIPAAERYGLMPAIDRWVVQRAFATLAQHKLHGDSDDLAIATCAINLSGTSLGDEGLLEFLRQQFSLHGIAPQTICFEITETSAIAHLPSAIRLMKELRQLGCRFALDDFGAGMSSFTYLKHLPVDYLKIDGAFVRDMLSDPTNHAMVEMINRIGQVMGKRTIAEFAESAEIIEALRAMGVDYAQGYAVARPRPFVLPWRAPAA